MSKKLAMIVATILLFFSYISPIKAIANTIREPLTTEEKVISPNNLIYALNIDKTENGVMRCTGTYIGDNYLLTAGHCMTDRHGSLNSTQGVTAETNAASHPVAFKAFKKSVFSGNPFKPMSGYAGFQNFKNDVGLIKVTEPASVPLDTSGVHLTVHNDLQYLVGKTISTVGYSRYFKGDLTKTQGTVLRVEEDGTLTVDFYVAEQNSGSPVFYNGEIIGVVTGVADVPNCQGSPMCSKATITPFTMDMKAKLFDPNGIPVSVIE